MRRIAGVTAALALGLTATAHAQAPVYPKPTKPTLQPKPKGPFHTLKVGKHAKYKTIGAAVKAAKAGDTIRVANGTYHEGVIVSGKNLRYLKIIGNGSAPAKVVLEGKGLKGAKAQNGIQVNGSDQVTVRGMTAQHYKANGFFFVNVNGYAADKLSAMQTGTYGIYAFNSIGGTMTDDVGAWNDDSGFYIGQTPPQVKPVRSIVKNVQSYGNVLGFSGTNMRYVTIEHSKFFNNGTGIVPNALHSEKYAPPEDNVITDNDVFWNNFNYFVGAPFKVKPPNADSPPYPAGVGILLFGSRTTQVTNNRIFGNYLGGAGMLQQFLLSQEPGAKDLIGNSITNNQFGLNGTDLNGTDLVYDGNGSGNCFSGNTGVHATVPVDGSTMASCPFTGANAFSASAQQQLVTWALADNHEQYWVKHPHPPQAGIVPLEHYADYTGAKPGKAVAAAASAAKKIQVGDDYYGPTKVTVKAGTTIKWSWLDENTNSHDVKLSKGPSGVKKFHSASAATDYSYSKKLTKPGTYKIVCTLHQAMTMTIKVK
jgi:plastocyanin